MEFPNIKSKKSVSELILTNNSGVHTKKAGEYGLMSVLMLHNHIPKIVTNQKNKKFISLFSNPIAGKTIVVVGTGALGSSMIKLLTPLGQKQIFFILLFHKLQKLKILLIIND